MEAESERERERERKEEGAEMLRRFSFLFLSNEGEKKETPAETAAALFWVSPIFPVLRSTVHLHYTHMRLRVSLVSIWHTFVQQQQHSPLS